MRAGNGLGAVAAAPFAPALAFAFAFAIAIGVATDAFAHRRDEYLQAARLAIAPGTIELQLSLTPGIAVADTIVADIDRNRDGALSTDEQRAYAERVLGAIAVDVDGRPLRVQPATITFPDVDAFKRGEGTIELRTNAALPELSGGAHRLSYRNTHRRDISVYLANALVPDSNRVTVNAQLRDADQRDLTIDYTLRDGAAPSLARVWLLGSIAAAAAWAALLLRSSRSSFSFARS